MPDSPPLLYLDTNVFLAYIEEESDRLPTVEALFEQAGNGKLTLHTSTVTIAEVAFHEEEKARGRLEPRIERRIAKLWLPSFPVQLVESHELVAKEAQWLIRHAVQEGWSLKPMDAIHLATAQQMMVDRVFTYDVKKWRKFGKLIQREVEEPWVEQAVLALSQKSDGETSGEQQ